VILVYTSDYHFLKESQLQKQTDDYAKRVVEAIVTEFIQGNFNYLNN
jgi:hypothetical protein